MKIAELIRRISGVPPIASGVSTEGDYFKGIASLRVFSGTMVIGGFLLPES